MRSGTAGVTVPETAERPSRIPAQVVRQFSGRRPVRMGEHLSTERLGFPLKRFAVGALRAKVSPGVPPGKGFSHA